MEKDPDKNGTQNSQNTDQEIKDMEERIRKVFQSSNWKSELLARFEAAEKTYQKDIQKYNTNSELHQRPCS